MKIIYMAGPLGPMGGGMLRVTEYLMQAQGGIRSYEGVELVKLDTRGTGNAISSIGVLARALGKIIHRRFSGELAGIHVNMAERLSVFRKGILLALARLIGVPTVLHLHAAQMESYYRSISPVSKFFTKRTFHLATHVIVLGDNARNFVIRELGVAPERVDVVINGVPPPVVPRRPASTDGRTRVLFLGNLWERKGVADLLKALALPGFDARDIEVLIAGGGDIQTYRDQCSSLGLDSLVTFVGWVNQQKAADILATADTLILPSYDEGLPLVILEALANGVAVICTPVGEIPTVLKDGVDALFIKPGDVPGIAAAIKKVTTDIVFREMLEKNGMKIYEEIFSLDKFSLQISRIHTDSFKLASTK